MSRVLIAGCGYVGSALGSHLAHQGHHVVGLCRSAQALPAGITPFTADITDSDALSKLPQDLEWVVYTVGASAFNEASYGTAYVQGAEALISALRNSGSPVQRVVFASSTAVYGQQNGEWVDEESPANATHFSGSLMKEAEDTFLHSGFSATVLRLGGIYGPGRTRLIDTVRDGTARLQPGPSRYLNLNHRDDCVGAITHLLELENPAPIYLGCDGHPENRNIILQWIANQLSVTLTTEEKTTPSQRGNRRCDSGKLVNSGYQFKFPSYQEGYMPLLGRRP